MSFFRRTRREVPMLNTASLPDLIFTVLFFFITVTHMRQVTLKVKYRVPEGTELTRLVKKSAVTHIYIGKPTDEMSRVVGNETCVQVNDKYADMDEVTDYVAGERNRMSPEDAGSVRNAPESGTTRRALTRRGQMLEHQRARRRPAASLLGRHAASHRW